MFKTTGFLAIILSTGNIAFSQNFAGIWRGEFIIQDTIKVPFNFEISKTNKVFLLNADERFESGNIKTDGDSLFIPLDQFDNELAFKINQKQLHGVLRKQDGGFLANVSAQKGITQRFTSKNPPAKDIGGKYKVVFRQSSGKEEESVGIFRQKGNKLYATFLKPSGDTRYLEGIVEENKFYLSSFIGSTPGYYHGSVTGDGELRGEQIGTKTRVAIIGKYDEYAALSKSRTAIDDHSFFDFALPDMNGNIVSLANEKYKNKVVVISVTGTWCPNCIDEAQFLSPWYKKNKDRGVEIILVHFERQADTAFAHKVMRRFKQRFDIRYDQVLGGVAARDSVIKALPSLKNFSAYPTTVFLNKQGKIAAIHKGFSGPATGKYYEEEMKSFNDEINKLLDE